jgi:hypothetical protein
VCGGQVILHAQLSFAAHVKYCVPPPAVEFPRFGIIRKHGPNNARFGQDLDGLFF